MMPEQPVHPQEEIDSDQQTIIITIPKCEGDIYENNRCCGSGRVQCRN